MQNVTGYTVYIILIHVLVLVVTVINPGYKTLKVVFLQLLYCVCCRDVHVSLIGFPEMVESLLTSLAYGTVWLTGKLYNINIQTKS